MILCCKSSSRSDCWLQFSCSQTSQHPRILSLRKLDMLIWWYLWWFLDMMIFMVVSWCDDIIWWFLDAMVFMMVSWCDDIIWWYLVDGRVYENWRKLNWQTEIHKVEPFCIIPAIKSKLVKLSSHIMIHIELIKLQIQLLPHIKQHMSEI